MEFYEMLVCKVELKYKSIWYIILYIDSKRDYDLWLLCDEDVKQ